MRRAVAAAVSQHQQRQQALICRARRDYLSRALSCDLAGNRCTPALPPFNAGILPCSRHGASTSAAPAADDKPPLVASRASNVGKLAGAIVHRVRTDSMPSISVIGPDAAYMALKSVIIASSYIKDTHAGKAFAVVTERREVMDPNALDLKHGLLLHVRLVPDRVPTLPPNLLVAGDANPGLVAGLMANILRESASVTLACMGASATSKALKATMIAQRYVAEMLSEGTGALALLPTYDSIVEKGEERHRILLRCAPCSGDDLKQ